MPRSRRSPERRRLPARPHRRGELSGPLVSVVVPHRGEPELLARCLESVRGQSLGGLELIVVDNGSGGEASELVDRLAPGAATVAPGSNLGFAGGANAGAARARAPQLVFLNSDVELAADCLEQLVACAARHPRAASVACKVLRLRDRRRLDGAGDCMTRSLRAYRRGQGELDSGQYEREEEVFSASGTACLWRADAFRSLGGFDESFFAYYEDVDLGFRARLAGHECWYAPRAVAYHLGAGSVSSPAGWRELESFWSLRNRWAMILKDAPPGWLPRNLPRVAAAEAVSIARGTLRGDAPRMLRAYADVIRERRSLRAKRDAIRSASVRGRRDLQPLVPRAFPPLRMAARRLRGRPDGLAQAPAPTGRE